MGKDTLEKDAFKNEVAQEDDGFPDGALENEVLKNEVLQNGDSSESAKTPRPYQVDCLQALASARESGAKTGLIVLASGLGKTFVSALDCKNFLDSKANEGSKKRVLFLCHREFLLVQARLTYQEVFGEKRTYGFFVGGKKAKGKVDFLFATFQSVRMHLEAFRPDEFDYIVVDEAHHAQANTFRKVMDYFEPEFALGMTATEKRLDQRKLEYIFGDVVYSMNVFEGIAARWLAETEYHVVMEDPRRFLKTVKRANIKSINAVDKKFFIPKRDEKIVRLIKKYANKFKKNPRIMIFCKTVEHAERIAKLFDKVGVVHSKRTVVQNFKTLEDYRNGLLKVIVSVQMLNEGLDVPETDVIVFLRNTVSPIVFFQQLGRGLRLCQDKQKVCVLDFVANCERVAMVLSILKQVEDYAQKFGVAIIPLRLKFAAMDETDDVLVESSVRLKNSMQKKKRSSPIELKVKSPGFEEDIFSLVEFEKPEPPKYVLMPNGFLEWLEETTARIYHDGAIVFPRAEMTTAMGGDIKALLTLFGKMQRDVDSVTDEMAKEVIDQAMAVYRVRLDDDVSQKVL